MSWLVGCSTCPGRSGPGGLPLGCSSEPGAGEGGFWKAGITTGSFRWVWAGASDFYFFFFNSPTLGLRLQNGLLTSFPVWQKPEAKGNCVRKVL